ncbi:MAG TPA: hypothetical protein VD788_16935 [Candidatus Polarisedimenticolaceae bacterium]|nr:hypothetical protein [Candidatus Polarisedimenticolaceae bacterium]
MRASAWVVSCLAAIAIGAAFAQPAPDTRFTADGERQILEMSDWLEKHPLAADRSEVFGRVLEWWVEAPQLTLNWCPAILREAQNDKTNSLVTTQAVVGAGAHLIRHRDEADVVGIGLAGVESALRAYESAVEQDPSYRDPAYDRLIERRQADGLSRYVTDKLKECEGDAERPYRDVT